MEPGPPKLGAGECVGLLPGAQTAEDTLTHQLLPAEQSVGLPVAGRDSGAPGASPRSCTGESC